MKTNTIKTIIAQSFTVDSQERKQIYTAYSDGTASVKELGTPHNGHPCRETLYEANYDAGSSDAVTCITCAKMQSAIID